MPWEKVKVMGVKGWKGEVDSDAIDSGKVFVEERMDDSRNTSDQFAEGMASTAYALGSMEAARALRGLPFPCAVEVDFQRVTNGTKSRTIVSGVRVPQAKGA